MSEELPDKKELMEILLLAKKGGQKLREMNELAITIAQK
jgi:hypothetical protein